MLLPAHQFLQNDEAVPKRLDFVIFGAIDVVANYVRKPLTPKVGMSNAYWHYQSSASIDSIVRQVARMDDPMELSRFGTLYLLGACK
jgi:hypothetical protein